jgi:hypothetical protein
MQVIAVNFPLSRLRERAKSSASISSKLSPLPCRREQNLAQWEVRYSIYLSRTLFSNSLAALA